MARAGANSPGLVHAQLFTHRRISEYTQQYVGTYCHTKGAAAVWYAAVLDARLGMEPWLSWA